MLEKPKPLHPDLKLLHDWNTRLKDGMPFSVSHGEFQESNIMHRMRQSAAFLVPYLLSVRPNLKDLTCLEVGCGMGAKALPLADVCKRYVGVDLDPEAIDVAQKLANHYDNKAEFIVRPADQLRDMLAEVQPDILVLHAVLEHLTMPERLTLLRDIWSSLKPGGLIYVGETPNRLTHIDYHSSQLPYFTMIPPSLAAELYDMTPRIEWKDRVEAYNDVHLGLHRRGHAVSFHEFWAVDKRTDGFPEAHLIADGFGVDILNWKTWKLAETDFLGQFSYLNGESSQTVDFQLHPAFARMMLNFVLEKPLPGARPANAEKRHDHLRMIPPVGVIKDWLGNPRVNLANGRNFSLSEQATEVHLGLYKAAFKSQIDVYDGDASDPMFSVSPSDYDPAYLDVCDAHIFVPLPLPTSGTLRIKSKGRARTLGVLERRTDSQVLNDDG